NTYLNLRYSHDCTAILEDLDNFLGSVSERSGGGRMGFPNFQGAAAVSPGPVVAGGFYTDDGNEAGSRRRSPDLETTKKKRMSVTTETQTEDVQTLYIPFPKLDPPSEDERAAEAAVTAGPTAAGCFPKPPRPKPETENTPLDEEAVSGCSLQYPS
ncbi:protein E31B, partial [Proboscivirus elephantidbeta4]